MSGWRDRSAENGRLAVGQVWRHHTTGDYRVVGWDHYDGKWLIARVGDNTGRARYVWPDYLRRNFHLVPQRPTPRDEASS